MRQAKYIYTKSIGSLSTLHLIVYLSYNHDKWYLGQANEKIDMELMSNANLHWHERSYAI